MAADETALGSSAPKWAVRKRIWRGHRHEASPEATPHSPWAPPYDVVDTTLYPRTPEPWPPPAPLPPARPEAAGGPSDDPPAGHGSKRGGRRPLAIGIGGAVLCAWVGLAVFVSGGHARTQTTSDAIPPPAFAGHPAMCASFPRGRSGSIQSISGSTLTVTDRRGCAITVSVDRSTVFTRTVAGSIREVKKGKSIVAVGVLSDNDATLSAGRIAISAPGTLAQGIRPFGGYQAGVAAGTVTDAAGSNVTVTEADGTTVTVLMSPATAVTATVAASLHDLLAGQTIVVIGTPGADGTLAATRIQEGTAGVGSFGGVYGRPPTSGSGPGSSAGPVIQS